MEQHIIRTQCPDAPGLIYRLTGVLFEAGLNIEDQGEYVDPVHRQFFMRTVVSGEFDRIKLVKALEEKLPSGALHTITRSEKKRVVLFATKTAHCLGDLLIRHDYGGLNAEILAVVSNHETLRSLVEKFDIPYRCIPHGDMTREQHEAELLSCVQQYSPEFLVLARYMRVLSSDFVEKFPNQVINIHHSFLPAFVGARPYRQALERGVKVIGATAHFVTSELDAGPIIAQDVVHVDHSKTEKDMIAAGKNVEMIVLAEALRLVFEDRVFVQNNRTIVFD